jgi:hypothetical protein
MVQKSHTAPHMGINTRNTRTGHGNTNNIPHTNKNNGVKVQEKTHGGKHTLAYINKNWQKGHSNKKKKQDIWR